MVAVTELSRGTETMQTRILIADDQPDVLRALHLLLKGNGYATETVSSPAELLEAVTRREYDLVLMDLNYARDTTSGQEGLDLLSHLKAIENIPPIIVMTGWATVGLAVEAMRRGVTDFVEKPWANTKLLESLQKQVAVGRQHRELAQAALRQRKVADEMASRLHQRDREIAEARAIQEGFLPREIPQFPGYEIASAWQSARVVGGDYFDVGPDCAATHIRGGIHLFKVIGVKRGTCSSVAQPCIHIPRYMPSTMRVPTRMQSRLAHSELEVSLRGDAQSSRIGIR